MKATAGYAKKELVTAVKNFIQSGNYFETAKLFTVEEPAQDKKRLKKALQASEKFQVVDETVWHTAGISFCGVASWGVKITIHTPEGDHRLQVLHLDRFHKRTVYAVPIAKTDHLTMLPQLDLSSSELTVIREMVNELDNCYISREIEIKLNHPAKATVRHHRQNWPLNLEQTELSDIIKQQPILLQIAVAALDSQIRVYKKMKTAPTGLYNFVPSKGGNADNWLKTVLRVLTLTNEPGHFDAGPILIQVKNMEDLKRWRLCCERFAVIFTGTGSLLWPLIEGLEEQERIIKSGGPLPDMLLPTIPISVCRFVLQSPYAVDIQLPEAPLPLTDKQQDYLRSGMINLMSMDTARQIHENWQKVLADPTAYRTAGFNCWREILLETILSAWGLEQDCLELGTSVVQQEELERLKREDALERGLQLLVHTERFQEEIVDRPASKPGALRALSGEAVAFWFVPSKGTDKGQKLLAFSGDSLKRLLRRVNCGEELYDAFIRRCEREGVLDQRNRPITLSGESFTAVTFRAEKF